MGDVKAIQKIVQDIYALPVSTNLHNQVREAFSLHSQTKVSAVASSSDVSTVRLFFEAWKYYWKDILRDSMQGAREYPTGDFWVDVSGVDAALETMIATSEGELGPAGVAAAGVFSGKARAVQWVLGKGKSAARWANQMRRRGWNDNEISEALGTEGIPARNAVNPGNPATRHVHPSTGRSVVIDNKTNEILHVGGDDFDYSDWDL